MLIEILVHSVIKQSILYIYFLISDGVDTRDINFLLHEDIGGDDESTTEFVESPRTVEKSTSNTSGLRAGEEDLERYRANIERVIYIYIYI